MKKELSVFLSGVGYHKLSDQRRKTLMTVGAISFVVNIVALVLIGSWVIMRAHLEEKTVFVATPPPMKTYEPKKLEHKVKVQKRQRSSSRPTVIPRLVAMKTSNLALPEIQVDPKVINTSFQPKFKAVSGKGVGVGTGTGYGVGGFGSGVSKFDFFGIKGRGSKIAILVDVSKSMIYPERGGFKGFKAVKLKVNQVIDALHDAAMFNVVVFAEAAHVLFPKMIIANEKNKRRSKEYLAPFNDTKNNLGLTSGNVQAAKIGLPAEGGFTRLDLALTACFQQGADTILIISDGAPMVQKAIPQSTIDQYNKRRAAWASKNAGKIASYNSKMASGEIKKVWVPGKKANNIREGGGGGSAGHWQFSHGHHPPKFPENLPKPSLWTLFEFIRHLEMLHNHFYLKKGMRPPVVHCIGYKIDKDESKFLKKLAKQYKGRYRKVNRIR